VSFKGLASLHKEELVLHIAPMLRKNCAEPTYIQVPYTYHAQVGIHTCAILNSQALPCCCCNPLASVLQQVFRDCISHPVGQVHLYVNSETMNSRRFKLTGWWCAITAIRILGMFLSYPKDDNKGLKVFSSK
jgi:hypothetical protein